MGILDVNGRPRSVRTEDEELRLLLQDIERLPEAEKIALKEVYAKLLEGDSEPYSGLANAEYRVAPVDIKTFLSDPYFLGETGASLWPRLADDIVELFEGEYEEATLGGSLGWGKSFFSTTAMAYTIYQMSCLKNPQRAYGIDIGSHIYVAMISVTEKVAKRVVINELIGKIRHSRYFQENFKPKEAPSQLEVRFPTNIQVVAGSTSSSAMIGLNVFSGLIDETSFLGESKKLDRHGREVVVDMGEQIYKSIIRRMKSRFQRVGRLPGVLILASSKERPSAFIEKRVHQAREVDDPMVFVREYATWDVHPAEKFSGKFFKVVVGTERISSRILSDDPEEEQRYQDLGLQIVNVPEDYRADFVNDIDGCLTGDTEIALLDGSSVPIRDLVGRDEFWTYSYGEDGRLYPGRGYDARLTHKQAEIISVLLDNGQSVRCTANHLFMLRDGTYRCAGELVPGDSLMPLDPNNHKVVSVTQAGKEDVYDLSVDGYHNFALTAGVVVHNSLRDIAGVATDVVSQYMNRTEKVYDCQDVTLRHPVGHGDSDGPMEEWVANTPLPIQWHLIARPFKRRLPGGYEEDAWRPIRHPDAIRFAHIDTSYAGDSSGICIAHVAGWTEVVRRDSYGEEYNELAPRIETDLVLGVVPPPGDEIMLADLRGIVYQFMSHGFNVGYVSLDSFQSIDTIQQLRKHGVEAEVVSIDKTTEPYDTLKTAMYEDRFRMSPHSVALREFRYLQRIPKNNGRVKIDHPKKNPDGTVGSKDVADSVAGVVYALSKKVPGMPMGIMVGTRETFDEKQDDSWVTGGRVLVQSTMSKGERQSTVDDHGGGVGVTSSLPFLKG